VPEAAVPRRRLLRGGGDRRRQSESQLGSRRGVRRGAGIAVPDRRVVDVRQAHDCRRGPRRSGKGHVLLPIDRRRHDAKRRRMPAAAGLQRRAARRRSRPRLQHRDRDRVQRAVEVRREGAASRRHDAPRSQVDRLRAPQEVGRRRQRTDPGQLQEGVRDVPACRLHRAHAADSRNQRRRGAHPRGPGVHPSVQERHRLRAAAGLGKYELLGEVYELDDYRTPSDDVVKHLQSIIDEAFGRSRVPVVAAT
jgi:hypothetical protein